MASIMAFSRSSANGTNGNRTKILTNFFSFVRFIALTISERKKFIEDARESTFKGAILRSLNSILYSNQLNYANQKMITFICKEHFMSIPVVIFTRKNFYLLESINEKISIFQAAGLIEF